MKIIESYLTKNDCYKANRQIAVKGLMLHSVGCPQSSATVFVKTWDKPNLNACVHAFIDGYTGDVYQTLPWIWRGWHGGGSVNNTHIGVEMCESDTIQYTKGALWVETADGSTTKAVVTRTYKSAVDLFAQLCDRFGLNPLADGVVISHAEGHKRGLASNHGDVEHIWNKFGLTMAQFRKDVKAAQNPKPSTPMFTPYLVKVTAAALNYRSGPGTNFPVNGTIRDMGTYTIIDEANGWGKLKSGAGWISLNYVRKL